MSNLLREYVSMMLSEVDRGGIVAQHVIVSKLKKNFPKYEFISNKKGQQSADVTILLKDKVVGAIESKSIVGGGGLTALFDNTISLSGETIFDEICVALAEANNAVVEDPKDVGESIVSQFLTIVGGSAGQTRPIPKDLQINLNNPDFGGYSHKLIGDVGGALQFKAVPGDAQRAKDNSLVIFRQSKSGVKAYMTVEKVGTKLITTSSPRPWASSGTIPVKGGISSDEAVKIAAFNLMKEHFAIGGDNYFILVDGDTIYPFIVPGMQDPLKLAERGAPVLSPASFEKAGLSTYGNAGAGKIRLALKAQFVKKYSL